MSPATATVPNPAGAAASATTGGLTTGPALGSLFAALPGSRRFDAEHREVVHRLAFAALCASEWESAHRYYEWLVVYGGADVRSWRGLAASAHALGAYAQALMCWSMVSLIEPPAVDATFYAARCQALLGDVDEAHASFALVAGHPGADEALRQQAEQMMSLLRQRRAA